MSGKMLNSIYQGGMAKLIVIASEGMNDPYNSKSTEPCFLVDVMHFVIWLTNKGSKRQTGDDKLNPESIALAAKMDEWMIEIHAFFTLVRQLSPTP